jgi:hypothetical protein
MSAKRGKKDSGSLGEGCAYLAVLWAISHGPGKSPDGLIIYPITTVVLFDAPETAA